MKRRGFLAALAAVPFVGRWTKPAKRAIKYGPSLSGWIPLAKPSGSAAMHAERRPGRYTVTFDKPLSKLHGVAAGDFVFIVGDREDRG